MSNMKCSTAPATIRNGSKSFMMSETLGLPMRPDVYKKLEALGLLPDSHSDYEEICRWSYYISYSNFSPLLEEILERKSNNIDPESLFKITKLASVIFNFDDFFLYNNYSETVNASEKEFLRDCLKFATTGKRRMRIETWQTMFKTSDGMGPSQGNIKKDSNPIVGTDLDFDRAKQNIVQLWLSQPNGVEDIVRSMIILFGSYYFY